MSDIVRDPYGNPLKRDATITALRAENEKLRAALEEIEYLDRPQSRGLPRRISIEKIARAALGKETNDE